MIDYISDDECDCSISWHYSVNAAEQHRKLLEVHSFKRWPKRILLFKTREGRDIIGLQRIFFFSFAYTTSPAAVMKLVVFFRSSKPPYNFWWSGVAEGHFAIRSGWCLLHIWRTCSVVWSSSRYYTIERYNSEQYLTWMSRSWTQLSKAI